MPQIPVSPLAPGDSGYSTIYDLWVSQGSAAYVEKLDEGWIRRAILPSGESQPTFVLLASHPGVTSENLDSGITGLGREMVTRQNSLPPRGSLPKAAV